MNTAGDIHAGVWSLVSGQSLALLHGQRTEVERLDTRTESSAPQSINTLSVSARAEFSACAEFSAYAVRTNRRGTTARRRCDDRRGVAAVEMAFVMPLFMVLLLGLMQLTSLLDTYNLFSMAAREGGRVALFEREGMVPEGTTTNRVVEQEVRRYLEAHGFEADNIEVKICFPGEPLRLFDLDDEDNSLLLFEVRVAHKLDRLLYTPPPGAEDQQLLASMVFRNSPGRLIQ